MTIYAKIAPTLSLGLLGRGRLVGMEVLTPRDVPLGGLRAMTVRRTLPQRQRSLIGAWCFLDHYGPDEVDRTEGMVVPPHPHTGLQTVSWLFTGEIEHRDSAGHHAFVRPGELNLMTAGRGISHSEYSTPDTTTLHGAQLWLALPDGDRQVDPTFEHFAPEPVSGDGWEARVFIGSLLGSTSPVTTYSPLLGAELTLAAGTTLRVPVDPSYELGRARRHRHPSASTASRWPPTSSGFVEPGCRCARAHAPTRTSACSCSAGRRSASRSSCGGTSSAASTTRWSATARSGRPCWPRATETGFDLPEDDPLEALHAPPLPNARMVKRGP